jgi:hypothetical protein
VAHLEELAASNPDLETEVIGQSWEGKASRVLLSYYYITVDFATTASQTSHAINIAVLSNRDAAYPYLQRPDNLAGLD